MPINDPKDLKKADQKIRINELKERIKEVAGEETRFDKDEKMPPEVEEQFLEQVLAYEEAPRTDGHKQLEKAGLKLPAPETLKDSELPGLIMEIVRRMAARRMYLTNTNHLSERELYARLYHDVLKEEMPEMPELPAGAGGGGWCYDMIGSGSDEDNETYLRYYADEETRKSWQEDYPKEKMPPHEKPPYDRDRHFPQMELGPPLDDEAFSEMMRELEGEDEDAPKEKPAKKRKGKKKGKE